MLDCLEHGHDRRMVVLTDCDAGIHRLIQRIGNSRLIFFPAINGVATEGGFELALGCDIRLRQAGDYSLWLPEVSLSLLPGAGGTQAMARHCSIC